MIAKVSEVPEKRHSVEFYLAPIQQVKNKDKFNEVIQAKNKRRIYHSP